MVTRVLSWDWAEQPDMAALADIIRDPSGGTVYLREVEDTGSDQYAVVVSTEPVDEEQARRVYLEWLRNEEEQR